jgi:hypothetical protein
LVSRGWSEILRDAPLRDVTHEIAGHDDEMP